MQQKKVSQEAGLNFTYYTKVGNRVLQIMRKIEQVMTEKLLEKAGSEKPRVAERISASRARKLRK